MKTRYYFCLLSLLASTAHAAKLLLMRLCFVMAGVTVCGLLASCASPFGDAYDTQGHRIVPVIEAEYAIPIDGMSGRPGIYSQTWNYFNVYHTIQGSHMLIYGVKDQLEQNKILARISELRTTAVKVDFYDDSRFERHTHPDGSGAVFRLDTPLLREVVVR